MRELEPWNRSIICPSPAPLTEAKEAHERQHHEPVRQAAGVAERGKSARGALDCAVRLAAAPKQRPIFPILVLHQLAARNRAGSKGRATAAAAALT